MALKAFKDHKAFWILSTAFLVQWILLAFNVADRHTWLLENILVLGGVALVVMAHAKGVLSTASLLQIFIFLSLHNIGAHYTYSKVPYNTWFAAVFGTSLNELTGIERNFYDRCLHFLFGFLLFFPLKDGFRSLLKLKGAFLTAFVFLVVIAISGLYELMEWAAAVVFSEDSSSTAFVGAQGDEWDSHKDQALAISGAVLIWALIFLGRALGLIPREKR